MTVGGKAALDWRNQIRVLAAHQGRGQLDELLSIQVSAQADGRFELAGLTPGRYRIQAAMDDIWLSPSVELTVETDARPPGQVALDIGRPGVPSVIRCVDGSGKPQVGVEASLLRPAGPLSERLWPKTFVADGAGVINLPPLEAGRHNLRIKGKQNDDVLSIVPLSGLDRCLELQVVVD